VARHSRKKGHGAGDHENAERWLLTYADMITLLVAFFIMMYSMSVLNLAKFNQVAISIKSGFGGTVTGAGHSVLSQAGADGKKPSILPEVPHSQPAALARQINTYIKQKRLQDNLRVTVSDRGVVVSIVTDKMLFPPGQAYLTQATTELLDKVSSLISKTDNLVRVEGHTDDLPINTPRFPSNWELSTSRATAVVRYLIEHDRINPKRISAAGYADSRPLVPNDSEAHRVFNRRVDIVILQGDEANSRQYAQ
jgi:chemotaxis protein MotB